MASPRPKATSPGPGAPTTRRSSSRTSTAPRPALGSRTRRTCWRRPTDRGYHRRMATPDETIEAAWETVFGALVQLRERWPSTEWMYDRRLRCVASSIPLAGAAGARAAFGGVLPTSWSPATLATAPASVQALAETCGGLRASQELLWGGDADSAGAFGLWWPWG